MAGDISYCLIERGVDLINRPWKKAKWGSEVPPWHFQIVDISWFSCQIVNKNS